MENILKSNVVILLILGLITCNLQSCGEKVEHSDDTLKGFMLAGPYVVNSYGGINEMKKYMGLKGNPSKEKIISLYKKNWVFFFDTSYKDQCSSTLKDYWDITDKASLVKTLDALKNTPGDFKAWDYARLSNNAALGYASGYLTKEEVNTYLAATLKLAQEQFPDWKAYFNNYNKGRRDWNPNAPDAAQYTRIVSLMQMEYTSIYKLIPLH